MVNNHVIKASNMLVYQLKRLLAGLVVVALFAGCNSEHAFDFSRLHDIEAEGTWGLPLMNADYTIGDILSLADNPELIQVGNDGTLEIHYEYEVDSVVSASKYLDSYFNNPIEVSGSASFPSMDLPIPSGNMQVLYRDTIPVAFPSDLVVINRADLKSGLITFNITYNVDRQVHVVATCPQIVNASGQPLRVDEISSNGTLHNTYDLSGYSLVLSNNSLEVYLEVSCPLSGAPLPSELSFSYNLSLSQILFSEIRHKPNIFKNISPKSKKLLFKELDDRYVQHIFIYITLMSTAAAAAAAKSLQSCPTLCDPMDGSPSGFPVPGILQAISFSIIEHYSQLIKNYNKNIPVTCN